MADRFQFLRSSTPNTKPLVNAGAAGEIWTNFADLQFGLIDPTRTAVPLIAVRYFSAATAYVGGDYVVQAGKIYVAKAAVPIGAFNAAQWTAMVTAADMAALYLPLTGGNLSGPLVLPGAPTIALQAATKGYVDGFLPLAGGALTGPLTLSGPPTQPLQAATKAYADNGAFVPIAGGTMTGPLSLSGDPTAATGAATKQYADTKLPLAGGTLTGNVTFASANPTINLQKSASGNGNSIYGYTGASARWLIALGDTSAESGSNVGSNLSVNRYTDAGAWIDAPFQMFRSSGAVVVAPQASAANTSQLFTVGARAGSVAIGGGDGLSYGANGIVAEFSLTAGNVVTVNRKAANGNAIAFMQNSVNCGSISVTGQSSTAFNTSSDVRLKRDEHDFDAGPILDAIQVYDFEWTSAPGVRAYGVMAQECNEVFPDAVTHIEHEDSWGVDYSKFVPLLLQEIKDLRARVAVLEGAKPT